MVWGNCCGWGCDLLEFFGYGVERGGFLHNVATF